MSLLAARHREETVQFMQAHMSAWQTRIMQAARRRLIKTGLHISVDDLEEAYGTAWHELHALQLDGGDVTNPEGWLVDCTAKRFIDSQRKQRPGAFADDITTDDVEITSTEDVVELLDDQRRLRHLREGMREHLSDRELQVATLIYLRGHSRREAADLLGIEPKRLEKIMDGDNKSRKGITKTFGAIVAEIESGQWCQKRGSLMRAYAQNVLAPDGERYQLAREHLADCSACRRYVQSLRNLAGLLPPIPIMLAVGHDDHPFHQLATLVDSAGGALDRTRETILHIAHQGHVHVDTIAAPGGPDGVSTIVKATGAGGSAAGAAAAVAAGGGGGAVVAGGAGTILAGGGGIVGLKIAATCVAALAVGTGCLALTEKVTTHHTDKPPAAKVAQHKRTQPKAPITASAAAAALTASTPTIIKPVAPPHVTSSSTATASRPHTGAGSSPGPAQAPSAPQEFGFERGTSKKTSNSQSSSSKNNSSAGAGSGGGSASTTSQAAKEFTPPPAPVNTDSGANSTASSGSGSSAATSAAKAPSAQAEFGIEGG